MRVLIVAVFYAPEHSGNAPYTTGLAEHLQRRGHEVTVLTGMPHYPAWKVEAPYRGRLTVRERRHEVSLVRRALYVPKRQSAMTRAFYEGTFLLTGMLPLRIPRPSVILGVVPSLSSGVLAMLLARRYGTPYGILFQDLMGPAAERSGISGGGRVARLTAWAEGRAIHGASAVAAVSESFFAYLRAQGAREDRLIHLPNWTHVTSSNLSDRARLDLRRELGWADDEIVALHAGNMGHKQNLAQVVSAAAIANRVGPRIRFVLMGDGNQRASLQSQVELGDVHNVQFLPPQEHERFMEVLAAADVLLVTERASVRDSALPSKLTSYAAAGRPVVAAVNVNGATEMEVTRGGMGFVVPPVEPAAIIEAVRDLNGDRDLAARLAAARTAYAARALRAGDSLDRAESFVELIAREGTVQELNQAA